MEMMDHGGCFQWYPAFACMNVVVLNLSSHWRVTTFTGVQYHSSCLCKVGIIFVRKFVRVGFMEG